MSHFTTVATEIRDQATLLRALKIMGCEVALNSDIVDWYGKRVLVAVAALRVTPGIGKMYDVGFARADDGTYKIVCDFDGAPKAREWVKQLTQRYAVERMRGAAMEQGYRVAGETKAKDGSIMLMLEV